MGWHKRKCAYFSVLSLLGLILVVVGLWPGLMSPLSRTFPTFVEVKPGTGFDRLTREWTQNGWLTSPLLFKGLGKIYGASSELKSGEYEVPQYLNVFQVYGILSSGKSFQRRVTFREGLSFDEMLKILNEAPSLKHTLANKSKAAILAEFQKEFTELPFLEGMFFPDTYFYHYGMSDTDILKAAHRLMNTHIQQVWDNRADNLPYKNSYEMLVMASIIEKETGVGGEREQVASVFVNRLKKKMRLQADPTVIYGLGEDFYGEITRKHLKQDTVYNTYTRYGLPPTPIAMPGFFSLKAAANPDQTNYLYFVAKEGGGHYFSSTLEEHNEAVERYLKALKKGSSQFPAAAEGEH